jgi:hypothetical protein
MPEIPQGFAPVVSVLGPIRPRRFVGAICGCAELESLPNHMRTLKRVSSEMSLHVLAYNLKRVIQSMGTRELIVAMRAQRPHPAPEIPDSASHRSI